MKTYTPTIGLEIHAELKTKTKMFCNSKNDPHHGEPNTHVCPICMGHPGTLPVVNQKAVEHVLRVGVAIGGTCATYTEFDRKNYFYPDIPKGYQISQYAFPLVSGGVLNNVSITRVHLEEDTARSLHDQGDGSIVDYNRAGVPLMELVTEPVIHDAKTAGDFARELQLLLRTLGVSDANMEKGEMRVEANVSVSPDSSYGTKVEIKNLNSFKAVEQAILYEVKRQTEALESGEKVVQETRGWDDAKGKTFSQRVKETAHDYRYFPDPDIPKFNLGVEVSDILSRIKESMPDLPQNKRLKYKEIGLTREQIEIIIGTKSLDVSFAHIVSATSDSELIKLAANYLVTDVVPLLAVDPSRLFAASSFMKLITLVRSGDITSRVAKDLLPEIIFEDVDPHTLAKERGLLQVHDDAALVTVVSKVVADNEHVVADFKNGKESALQYLIGQGMKASRGSANPARLAELFREHIL